MPQPASDGRWNQRAPGPSPPAAVRHRRCSGSRVSDPPFALSPCCRWGGGRGTEDELVVAGGRWASPKTLKRASSPSQEKPTGLSTGVARGPERVTPDPAAGGASPSCSAEGANVSGGSWESPPPPPGGPGKPSRAPREDGGDPLLRPRPHPPRPRHRGG